MSHAASDGFLRFFGTGTVKGVFISLLMGVLGFTGRQLLTVNTQQTVLEQHTKQLADLKTTADANADALQTLAVTTARIDGKVDAMLQRLSDRRSEAYGAGSAANEGHPSR